MKISTSIEINSPPQRVFPWVAEPMKAIQWQTDIKESSIIEETPEKVGTRFAEVIEEDGKSLEMQGEITDYIEDECISFHLDSRIHSFNVNYSIKDLGRKSLFTIDLDINWKFPMNLMNLVMGAKIKQGILEQTQVELQELKRLCESTS